VKHASEDDIVVRIRPDVKLECTPQEFADFIQTAPRNGICIPKGNDIFHPSYLSHTKDTINDQIAYGRWKDMKVYCTLYSAIDFSKEQTPLISEAILLKHLVQNSMQVHRVDLPYTLCLADCKFVAITGDSGVGKSTLVNALRAVFPYDSNLVLETDRYHKWERSDTNWQRITHLNPEANFLEKMQDDTFRLKIGENITTVDYDHATGKFTPPETIESKNFVFLCGLHTLYKEEIRAHTNVKIYIDTERSLKRLWKIQRDMRKRGYTFERCAEIFAKREADFERFILPQKAHADLVVHYYAEAPIPHTFSVNYVHPPLRMYLETAPTITPYLSDLLDHISEEVLIHPKTQTMRWYIQPNLAVEDILIHVPDTHMHYIRQRFEQLQPSYLGVLQVALVLILLEPTQHI
jgi:uridine kinase